MSAKRSMFAGFVIALGIGLLGGFGVRALADGMATPEIELAERRGPDDFLRVQEIGGDAWLLTESGQWRPAREEDVVTRPTGFRTAEDARLRLFTGGATIEASRGARVLVSGPKNVLRLYAERGRVVVHSPEENVEIVLGTVEVAGRSFGVWSRGNRSVVAAISRDVVIKRNGQQQRFGPGNEILVGADAMVPTAMAPELRVELEKVERRGNKFYAEGRTSKHAVLMLAGPGERTQVPVGPEGRFTTVISQLIPAPGELVAYDAAGREAQVGHPSPSLEVVAERLSGKGDRRGIKDEPPKVRDEYDAAPRTSEKLKKPKAPPEPERAAPEKRVADKPRAKERKPERAKSPQEPEDTITLDLPSTEVPPVSVEKDATPPKTGEDDEVPVPQPAKREKPAPERDEPVEDEVKLEWD